MLADRLAQQQMRCKDSSVEPVVPVLRRSQRIGRLDLARRATCLFELGCFDTVARIVSISANVISEAYESLAVKD